MPIASSVIPSLPSPKIAVVEGAFLYWTASTNILHRPHLVKVYVPLGAPIVLSLPEEGARLEFSFPLVVAPDLLQEVHVSGARYTLFLDPETAGHRAREFLRRMRAPFVALDRQVIAPLVDLAPGVSWGERLLDALCQVRDELSAWEGWGPCAAPPREILDVAARIVMGHAGDREELAATVGWPARTLTNRFRAITGLSLRRYGQWAKLTRALAAATLGSNFSATSAIGGFSDQAHFCRSTRELLGSVPTGIPFDMAIMRGNYYAGLGPLAAGFLDSLLTS